MEANCHAVLPVTRPCSYPDDGGEDTRSTERTSDEVNSREIDVALLGSSVGRSVSSDLAIVPVTASVAAAENIADEHADLQGAENIDGCTETEDIGTSFCRKMFRKVPKPLLPRPDSPPVVQK